MPRIFIVETCIKGRNGISGAGNLEYGLSVFEFLRNQRI